MKVSRSAWLSIIACFPITFRLEGRESAPEENRVDPTIRQWTESAGRLDDGTEYLVRMPVAWNGIAVGDLDYKTRAEDAFYRELLKQGFAVAGTARRPDRLVNLSQREDVERVRAALRLLASQFSQPRLTVMYGRSAGGGAALVAAERFITEIDGVVATCATTPFLSGNHRFDLLYFLKALLAPDDPNIEVHPISEDIESSRESWLDLIDRAKASSAGRARISLAFTAAQFPGFGHAGLEEGTPPPIDPQDSQRVADAMVTSLAQLIEPTLRNLRQLNTNPAPMVWNDGADYSAYFDNVTPARRLVVEELYEEAGLDLSVDLDALGSQPRIRMDPSGVTVWRESPLQMSRGRPLVPVFRMHTTGDQSIALEQTEVYAQQVALSGSAHLVRTATVDRGGHCTFTLGEELTALRLLIDRLESGFWSDTEPATLNNLANGLDPNASHGFVKFDLLPFNGAWRLSVPLTSPDEHREP
jgi:pimeloyl-ACP methyl ester carboxylesterase